MTINGFLRAASSAHRRAERAQARHARADARAAHLRAKENEAMYAAAEVEEFEDRMQTLAFIHREVGDSLDWKELVARPHPKTPVKSTEQEDAAVKEMNAFRPSILQRLLGKADALRREFEVKIAVARAVDQTQHEENLKVHAVYAEQLATSKAFAQLVLAGDSSSYGAAIQELDPFSEIKETGFELEVQFPAGDCAVVDIIATGVDVVPFESKTLTKTGKVSVKPMPVSRRFEVYQDFICGCALRVAQEIFSLFPLRRVIVNVSTDLLDSSDGQVRPTTILAVDILRQTTEKINLQTADASDSMRLFVHRMAFKRGVGFEPVTRIES